MSSDSQNNKQHILGNVVAIASGEGSSEIEQKLAAARRLFSLHEYLLCEQVVQEVLALDPQSSKAKALLELTSIKLSKRKLYRKMVDPQLPSRPLAPPPKLESEVVDTARKPPPRANTSNRKASPPRPTRARAQDGTFPPLTRSDQPSLPVRPEGTGGKPFTPPTISMRERTISAMVELLKDRKKGLGEWKDPRFERGPQEHSGEVAHAPVSDRSEATFSLPTPPALIPEAVPEAKVGSSPEKAEQQSPIERVLQNSLERKSSLRVDFLPGSLAELFEKTADRREEQLSELEKTAQSVETAPLDVIPIPEESPAPLQGGEVLTSPLASHPAVSTSEKEVRQEADRSHLIIKPSVNIQGSTAPVSPTSQEPITRFVHLPDVDVFDRITPAREAPAHEFIQRKLEQRSEEIQNSGIKSVSIAKIKKYLYKEQYDLCSQELEKIRELFPQSAEIREFAENTSRRLVELKAIKNFEVRAKELMRSAVSFYQEGRFADALDAARQVLQVNPNHTQAREFVEFVQRRINSERKKEVEAPPVTYCKTCGTSVDSSSQFCHHCGKRLL